MSSSPAGAPNVTLAPENSLGSAIETETLLTVDEAESDTTEPAVVTKRPILHISNPSTGDRSVALLHAEDRLLELRLRRRTRGSDDYTRDARNSMRHKIENWQMPETDHKAFGENRSRGRR